MSRDDLRWAPSRFDHAPPVGIPFSTQIRALRSRRTTADHQRSAYFMRETNVGLLKKPYNHRPSLGVPVVTFQHATREFPLNTQSLANRAHRMGPGPSMGRAAAAMKRAELSLSGMSAEQAVRESKSLMTDPVFLAEQTRANYRQQNDQRRARGNAPQGAPDFGLPSDRRLGIEGSQRGMTKRLPGAWNLENIGQQTLNIEYMPARFSVQFPAFVTAFSDAYTSNWKSEKVYGRMDPMGTFQNTRRAISIAWEIPADSFNHAMQNLVKVNKLISFLYPVYARHEQNIGVMNMDPFWRVQFGNLIQNSTGGPLLGYVNGITFDPMVENGFFYRNASKGVEYYPKSIRLNFEFTVLHEHSLGFMSILGKRETSKATVKDREVDRVKVKYRFSEPKVNFGNFPYVTPQYERAIRAENIFLPTEPVDEEARNMAGLPVSGSAVTGMGTYDQFLWNYIHVGNPLDATTLEAAYKAKQINLEEAQDLLLRDYNKVPSRRSLQFVNPRQQVDFLKTFGITMNDIQRYRLRSR